MKFTVSLLLVVCVMCAAPALHAQANASPPASEVFGIHVTAYEPYAADEDNDFTVPETVVRYVPQRQIYGVHLLEIWSDIEKQVRWSHRLIGDGGYVKCFFTDITHETTGPAGRWIELVNRIYQYNMVPFLRLAGEHVGPYWEKPYADEPGDYTSIAEAMKRVVAGLPRKEGVPIYVEVWNEPNLAVEWTGEPNLKEYADFFVAVSKALRSLNDPNIKILNGGLALSGSSTEQMIKAHPEFIDAFDVWSTHPYPQNHPPDYNIIDGTARFREATIDAYRLETDVIERHGRKNMPVMITETGHDLGNNSYGHEGYPIIDDMRRADYIMRAFRDYWSEWPEVMAVFPFIFHDSSDSGIWANFVWVASDSDTRSDGWPTRRSLQYDYVANLTKPLDPHACISGKVLEVTLDTPVRGAVVRAEPGGHRTETDLFGNYMLPKLPPGDYTLSVQRRNYRFVSEVRPIEVDRGQNAVVDLYVRAEGKGAIEGVVTDAISREPVSDARVSLQPSGTVATTDAGGRYSLRGATPGWYRVTAEKDVYTVASQNDVALLRDETVTADLRLRSGALPGGPNMMANHGFEEGDRDGVALGWNNADGHAHPRTFSIDTATQFSGRSSQRINVSMGAINYVWQMTGYGSIKPIATYIIQVWAKAEGVVGSGHGAALRATFLTNDNRHMGSGQAELTLAGTTDWELLTLEMEAPPDSQRLQVVLQGHGEQGTVYFDDVYAGVLE